ncbi:MAG: MFS transporter, partial [Actinobacteria bacterium]|nr:MFS transporter [Actinomycetota bacterium]
MSTEPGTLAGGPTSARTTIGDNSHSSPHSLTPRQEAQLLAVLSTTMFVVLTSINMLAPILLDLANEFHTSLGTVGQLTAAGAIPWAVLAPFMGVLSDRHGRRPVLAIGLVVLGLATILSSQAQDFTSLFIIRVIGGIGGATTGPNAMAAPA